MKAAVLRSYGPPDALELTDVQRPAPGDDEVLVRVRATSVNPYDWHHIRGEPLVARLMPDGPGLRGPSIGIPGCDMAGQVESVGRNVTEFRPGDDVYALLPEGGFGEYVCVREDLLAAKPANLSYEQAAAVPMAGVTALVGLRDAGRLQPGQQVLVNGASGGVGTFAVQLARAFGAIVTGVCSSRNVDLVRSLGADEVVDYTAEDFTRRGGRYDLLLDNAGSRTVPAYRRVLTRNGTLVLVGGPAGRWLQPAGRVFAALAVGPLVSQRIAIADAVRCPDKKQCLRLLADLIEDGKVTPVVDRRYPFAEIRAAVRYQEEGHSPGKVVVTI
ncbi:NAD(P)-dependent alcohol dehydrogenase [Plantactinospora sp. KLBMP9567]|uniref:NAD(P)-dependent alcohol dehydrogenase n=1 Tax=Plantactinospora sp. KLBMP9567 TaxID=3085900 RepID=UPI002981D41A|nr:NAD(P)-dependent alcohol dehydrogenase [Plantactinospora sp. KLBMP9567]MDW5324199.1 NAD(P)-dependent alcohol dehydrogenase [Plantactinospora sp. KLBMP9567]